MLERWIAFKSRIDLLIPSQENGGVTPAIIRQILKEFVDMVLFSRFGIDEQTFTAVQNVETNGALASNEGLVFDFAGLVRVERNGRSQNVWRGTGPVTDFDCYFTVGNTTRARPNGQTKKGDRLRWNAKPAGALLSTDLLKVSAMVSLSSGDMSSITPSASFDQATDEETLAALASGPYPRQILWDSGVGKIILYAYSPRAGLLEIWSINPTTPRAK